MDEFSLIEKIKEKLKSKNDRVLVGIGDDSAVLVPPKGNLITTTDCLVESVHFDLSFIQPEELGHRALAVNLSDIAAMGGSPLYALVSLGIRPGIGEEFLLKMYDGIKNISAMFKTAIVGGNITSSPDKFFIDVTLIGEGEKYWTRAGANAGDFICVTGKLGGASSGLKLLQKNNKETRIKFPQLASPYLMPIPRVLEAQALLKMGGVTSAIDISDGLSSELHHLSRASGLEMEIEENKIPYASGLEEACHQINANALELSINGGEDYELLITLKPSSFEQSANAVRSLGTKLTKIGTVGNRGSGVWLLKEDKKRETLPAKGWKHFL